MVNPYFPDKRMLDEIRGNFNELISHYPSGRRVNNLIASRNFMVRPAYVSVGNGASELIKSLMEHVIINKTGIVFPTFEEYPNRMAFEDAVIFTPDNRDFTYTVDDLMLFFSDKEISALILINPDNPSGNFIKKADLLRLCEWAEENSIRLIVDESFVDFSKHFQHNSLIENEILSRFPHLIVIKSISKSYGVAGLRLGVMFSADADLISYVNHDLAIWNINSFAEFYMQIFSKYENEYHNACLQFIEERERFYLEFEKIEYLRVIPSQANYFLCEVLPPYTSGALTEKLLVDYSILIKDCSLKKGFSKRNYVRIAVRNKEDNNKLIEILKTL